MNYSKRPFDKQQLIFMVDTILASGLDSVESTKKFGEFCDGCKATVGNALSTLFTKLTGHEMAVDDAVELIDFSKCGRTIYDETINYETRSFAVSFVNNVFAEYLENIPTRIVRVDIHPGESEPDINIKTNFLKCEEVFVEKCKELYNDDHGNDFESWICELADAEEFSIDLAMCVTNGKIKFPVSMGSDQEIMIRIV